MLRPHSMRPRKYIPLPEKLAAALACLLPQERRDDLRARKIPASEILALFQWDHIILFSFDGSDSWWNLDPKTVLEHRQKSKADTSIVAKAKRIDKKWIPFTLAMAQGQKPSPKPSRWPKRPFQNRTAR